MVKLIKLSGNNPVKYTDPDGRFCISYYYNEKYDRYCFGMSTFHDRSKFNSWTYYHLVQGVASWIPFGGYLTNLYQGIENFNSFIFRSKYRLIYNSDCAGFDIVNIGLDIISLFFPKIKGSKYFDAASKYLSIKNTLNVYPKSQADHIISDFMNSQESDLFYGVLYDFDAIVVGKAYARAALDYESNNLSQKGISKSEWGLSIRKYLWNHEKDANYKMVYGNSEIKE